MRRRLTRAWIAVLVALLAVRSAAQDTPPAAADADVVVKTWLVLAPVDVAARRTLRPDAVFAKYLLDRTTAAPKEGDEVVGTLGKPAKWSTKDADKDGDVEADNGAWAYASVDSPAERVVIAKLEGASQLFVGGAGFTGDAYRLGDVGVPVALKKGANDLFVTGMRGGFRLTLSKPAGAVVFDVARSVVPDVAPIGTDALAGPDYSGPSDPAIGMRGSCLLLNATTSALERADRHPIVPLGRGRIDTDVHCGGWGENKDLPIEATSKEKTEPRRRTFISHIDGSVQSYALVPPAPSDVDKSKIGLVLSLHGASVECMNQAKAYVPKPDFWIVCPTNRGNFGFDWQDWGRLDAYEVLDDALKVTGVDPRRVYLTGHSMGGHGVWHLAANDPGRFLAIAPSAGWCSWDTYQPSSQVMSPLAWMWRAADGASWTRDLIGNLAQIPTYVLHGEKDDNVPVSEAHLMIDAITKAGGKPESHFEPGAGHWWDDPKTPGAECVDWPGIWELFRKTEPTEKPPNEVSFTTMDPSIQARQGWIEIKRALECGRPCRVSAKWDGKRSVSVTTENVRALMVFSPAGSPGCVDVGGGRLALLEIPPIDVTIDGQTVAKDVDIAQFERGPLGWRIGREDAITKEAEVSGPFKRAFTNRFVLVYGTAGDESENRELLERARYDSEVWAYRANGDANLMSDTQFLAGDFKDRNVIVYGNADTNKAWSAVFDDDCPIVAKRGVMTVGGAKHEGVVAAAFVRPRKGTSVALAAAFADTGAVATRLFYEFPVFSSGVGIPDYVVFGPGFLKEMDGDVRAAGWFDYAWRMR